jgi:hypothetical protein
VCVGREKGVGMSIEARWKGQLVVGEWYRLLADL